MGNAPKLGRKVAIYGGGNTAMDAARVALRLGHEPMIIYRRTREQMPAHEFEADEALEEGVKIHWLRTIKSIDVSTFTVEVMEIDEKGRPKPTGETRDIGGQRPHPGTRSGHGHRIPAQGSGRRVQGRRHGCRQRRR